MCVNAISQYSPKTWNKEQTRDSTLLIKFFLIKKILETTWFKLEIIVFILHPVGTFFPAAFPTRKVCYLQNLLGCFLYIFFVFCSADVSLSFVSCHMTRCSQSAFLLYLTGFSFTFAAPTDKRVCWCDICLGFILVSLPLTMAWGGLSQGLGDMNCHPYHHMPNVY